MHYHWLVFAHEGIQQSPLPGGGASYIDVVEIDVMAAKEDEALGLAQELAPGRQSYLLKKVSQHEEHTGGGH